VERQSEHAPDGPVAPGRTAPTALAGLETPGPAAVLRLQRCAGNAAVVAMLARRGAGGAAGVRGLVPGVLARDPLPGGAAGQTADATGGALSLQSVEGSFVLPAGKLLSGTTARQLRTEFETTVAVRITSDAITLTMRPALYIDAQWPVQNMRLSQVVYTIASEQTSVGVSLVNDEWGDGFIDATGTAQESIAETIAQIVRRTPLHREHAHAPPTMVGPRMPQSDALPPAYDPLRDEDPQATLQALIAGFQSLPGGAESDVGAGDMSRLTVGATVTVNREFNQTEGGAGVHIGAGTAITLNVEGGASVTQLQGAGHGAAALASAANIQAIRATSAGIEVLKDGARVATIDAVTIHRGGTVSLDRISLHGEAADMARSESGLRLLVGGLAGLGATGSPEGFQAGVAITQARGDDTATIVPGITRAMIQSKLQQAFTSLLAQQGRTAIPGVDLGSVLGVPGAPVQTGGP